uniref:N-terminal kinase-like protein n=1 Tax=Hirondellea gigas TaxID=1518452 RepID=A0A6A7FQD4_9CRUS
MWSIFSRDPTTSFPYEVGDVVKPVDERSIFTLHYAKKKACGSPVSAFVCLGAVRNNSELELARAAVRRLKSFRHPCILNYLDSLESEKAVYLITVQVSPLQSWLLDCQLPPKHKSTVIAWGIRQVLQGVNFLNIDAKLEHLNICSPSIFVTPGGEWRIAGVEYCRPLPDSGQVPEPPPNKLPPSLNVYDTPEKLDPNRRKLVKAWSNDTWGMGCLIWEVFTATPLMQSGALRNTAKLPASVLSTYKSMLHEDPSARPQCSQVLEQLSKKGALLDNDLISTMDFLDNIDIKHDAEKHRFFSELTKRLDNIPNFIAKNKILPATLAAHQFSNVGSVVLAPLFKMSKLLSDAEYQEQVLPSVVKLFSSSDRATRLHLLQQMEQLITHMDYNTVNDKVFTELATGFLDTNPTIREHTVKSVLHLAPKLNKNNLNVEVLKHFARLQSKDEQGGIRTNCTVCLGKIASNLSPSSRQKCLISAFTRALKDPFPPARVAGVMALAATQHYYPLDQVAGRVLPSLCQLTLDPDKSVRDAVFRVIKGFMGKLEKVSEDPNVKEEMESDVLAESSSSVVEGGARGWAGWAVGTLTSKFYKSSISTTAAAQQQPPSPTPDAQGAGANRSSSSKNDSSSDVGNRTSNAVHSGGSSSAGGSGSSTATLSFSSSLESMMKSGATGCAEGDGWGEDDDQWKPLDEGEGGVGDALDDGVAGWEDAEEDLGNLQLTVTEDTRNDIGTAAASATGMSFLNSNNSSRNSSMSKQSSARSSVASSAAIVGVGTATDNRFPASAVSSNWSSINTGGGNSNVASTSSYVWSSSADCNPDSDDFFTSLSTDKSSSKTKVAAAAPDSWSSSWDEKSGNSAGGDGDGGPSSSASSGSRDYRDQKRVERQKQIEAKRAAKGPMKLGTKKS